LKAIDLCAFVLRCVWYQGQGPTQRTYLILKVCTEVITGVPLMEMTACQAALGWVHMLTAAAVSSKCRQRKNWHATTKATSPGIHIPDGHYYGVDNWGYLQEENDPKCLIGMPQWQGWLHVGTHSPTCGNNMLLGKQMNLTPVQWKGELIAFKNGTVESFNQSIATHEHVE
jgi:hypothetical protein